MLRGCLNHVRTRIVLERPGFAPNLVLVTGDGLFGPLALRIPPTENNVRGLTAVNTHSWRPETH